MLIYGVPEDKNPDARGGAPIPRSAADKIGFQPNEVSKETVENLITSNVQPRPHPNLFQITEVQFVDGSS